MLNDNSNASDTTETNTLQNPEFSPYDALVRRVDNVEEYVFGSGSGAALAERVETLTKRLELLESRVRT